MTHFSERELKRLLEVAQAPCLSIYLPTHRMGAEIQQDSIRLKNLLSQAESELLEKTTLSFDEIKNRLSIAWTLVDDFHFWQHQEDGLALFFTEGHTLMYRFPLSFQERVVVSEQFYIRPLLPMLSGDGKYFVLAASQNEVHFYGASRDRIYPIEVDGLTASLDEALKYDVSEQAQQMHQGRTATYHGHGAGKDRKKDDILRFFQQVDRDLQPQLRNTEAPLVFVGVDYLFPIYQMANSYPHLRDEFVAMNPDQIQEDELHQQTWPLVQPLFERSRNESIAEYSDRLQTRQTTSSLYEVLNAAHDGQIATLLVANDQQLFGRFDATKRQLYLASEPTGGNEDLYNLAAIYTLFCRGKVYAVDQTQIPNHQSIAAILRYPTLVNSASTASS